MAFDQAKFDELMSGVTYSATFVPHSQSRLKDEKCPSLNWRVVISTTVTNRLETDYTAGMACVGSRIKDSLNGKYGRNIYAVGRIGAESKIAEAGQFEGLKLDPPPLADVVCGLVTDATAIDHASFEDWASEYGFDTDSRSAEKIYRSCIDIGLKLRSMFGDAKLAELRELFQDF